MFVAENFIRSLVGKYGKHTVYTDSGTWYPPQARNFLHLKHRLHSSLEKSLVERVMEYFKDRIGSFDNCYPCINQRYCNLSDIYNWLDQYIYLYNTTIGINTICEERLISLNLAEPTTIIIIFKSL